MSPDSEERIYIALDDPPPRGARWIAVAVGIVFLAMIAAPFMLGSGAHNGDIEISRATRPTTRSHICQPAVDLPEILDPVTHFALPSWMRLCDWFAEPVEPSIDRPPRT